jgi:hypothetical protein
MTLQNYESLSSLGRNHTSTFDATNNITQNYILYNKNKNKIEKLKNHNEKFDFYIQSQLYQTK